MKTFKKVVIGVDVVILVVTIVSLLLYWLEVWNTSLFISGIVFFLSFFQLAWVVTRFLSMFSGNSEKSVSVRIIHFVGSLAVFLFIVFYLSPAVRSATHLERWLEVPMSSLPRPL